MATPAPSGWVTSIQRMWMLGPFQKALRKRERETVLLQQLDGCVEHLFRDPNSRGLNLETLRHAGPYPVLSARITDSYRLILISLAKNEVGLLYFDNHDEAYAWVRRNERRLPTMLTRTHEITLGAPIVASFQLAPAVRSDEESPLAIASTEQFRRLTSDGVGRYLTALDEEQRRLAELNVKDLLVVKGGAGTGKTAVAIHRLLNVARQPVLVGPTRVLYLCFNTVLARTVQQLLGVLSHGSHPKSVEVSTFHSWCARYLNQLEINPVTADNQACEQAVFHAFGKLSSARRSALGDATGRFVNEEIEQVIVHNGIASREEYFDFPRHGRPNLKRPGREAIWHVWQESRQYQMEQYVYRWSELPGLAIAALGSDPDPPQYRAVVIDEGQDCSPTMVRLARRFVDRAGSLTVFADPSQTIYECGFQWTQRELRPSGGNVRWLRRNFRLTREIYDLARPLLDGFDDLKEDIAQMETPVRRGPRPSVLVMTDEAEARARLVEHICGVVADHPPEQIGVLAGSWRLLDEIASDLTRQHIPVQLVSARRGVVRIQDRAVKLLTIHGAKGLDFRFLFLVGPTRKDLGGEQRAELPETRRALYVALTRASEQLTVLFVYGNHHPLLEKLDDQHYDADGPSARAFVNTRGLAL